MFTIHICCVTVMIIHAYTLTTHKIEQLSVLNIRALMMCATTDKTHTHTSNIKMCVCVYVFNTVHNHFSHAYELNGGALFGPFRRSHQKHIINGYKM